MPQFLIITKSESGRYGATLDDYPGDLSDFRDCNGRPCAVIATAPIEAVVKYLIGSSGNKSPNTINAEAP